MRDILYSCMRSSLTFMRSMPGLVFLVVLSLAGMLGVTFFANMAAGDSSGEAETAIVATAGQVGDQPVEVRELWTGALYTSTYRVGICFSALGDLRGVVHLKLRTGEVDVYHIIGEVNNNEIRARHSSGHTFEGRLVSADAVEGIISLKSGMRVRLEGRREHNARLAEEDCAPLP